MSEDAATTPAADGAPAEPGLWVFGYGSLIWNPGFQHTDRRLALLPGYRRSFCMRSIHHRGTPERPGLVLALDAHRGSACDGVAFAVPPEAVAATLEVLRERELISSAYLERRLQVRLRDGPEVEAVTYVVDPHHAQYCGTLTLEAQARIIARAEGGRGPNSAYLRATAAHLSELGLADAELDWLAGRVADLQSTW